MNFLGIVAINLFIFEYYGSMHVKIIRRCYKNTVNVSPSQAKNLRFCHSKIAEWNKPPDLRLFQNCYLRGIFLLLTEHWLSLLAHS